MKLYSTLLLIACLIALPVKTLGQEAEIVKQGIQKNSKDKKKPNETCIITSLEVRAIPLISVYW